MFIIELEKGVFAAGWENGDPSRTLLKESAKVFATKSTAERQVRKILKDCPNRKFINLKIIEL